jgi:hypothetical protein
MSSIRYSAIDTATHTAKRLPLPGLLFGALLACAGPAAADDCPDGNHRCRAAQERAQQQQQQQQGEQAPADTRKQQPAQGHTGGAARWDPDTDKQSEPDPDE